MKELKFRVFEEREKAYDTWSYILDESGNLCRNVYGALICCDKKDYIVEQYTGLKDKNGKEIFIGDIVSEHNGDIIGEIIQKPSGEYCIAWIGIYAGSSVLYDELSMCEVIGNVHENADLLEGK